MLRPGQATPGPIYTDEKHLTPQNRRICRIHRKRAKK